MNDSVEQPLPVTPSDDPRRPSEKTITHPNFPVWKFAPPRVESRYLLDRSGLLAQMTGGQMNAVRPVFIEAQAGQGKSTLAAQYLKTVGHLSCWYQIEDRDNDPVYFLSAFYQCLTGVLTGFRSDLVATMIANHELTTNDAPPVWRQLLADLDAYLKEDFYIVVDDLHLLAHPGASIGFVSLLLEHAPRRARLVLVSRQPVKTVLDDLPDNRASIRIDNTALALSRSETAELFNSVFQIALSLDTIREIHRITDGWMMGLILAGKFFQQSPEGAVQNQIRAFDSLESSAVFDYLFSEVFNGFSPELQQALIELSILAEVSLGLSSALGHTEAVRDVLIDMVRNNFFMRFLDSREDNIGFHHLFRDCVKEVAARELTDSRRTGVLHRAAGWYLDHGRPETALRCYLEGGFYGEADDILQKVGLPLMAGSQLVTLQAALEKIPHEIIRSYPWLSFFFGVVCLNFDPPAALSFFSAARRELVANGDEQGELLVLTQIIYYHITVDARQDQNSPLVDRAKDLFRKFRSKLGIHFEIQAAIAIAQGYSWFKGDLVSSDRFSLEAVRLANKYHLVNFMAISRITRAYRFAFEGRWNDTKSEIEACVELSFSPRLNANYKYIIAFIQVDMLGAIGDFTNFVRRKTELERQDWAGLLLKSVYGPFVVLRYIDYLIAIGQYEEAISYTRAGLENANINRVPHLHSQYLQYSALLGALTGDIAVASSHAELALNERSKVGISPYVAFNCLILGAAYTLIRESAKGESALTQAVEISSRLGNEALQCGAHANRACIYLLRDDLGSALADVRSAMQYMRRNHYIHYFGWNAQVMQTVLATAVTNGIETDYARKLASERLAIAILDDGSAIPLLQFKTLGQLKILIDDTTALQEKDLTRLQRQLLALLIASPGFTISTEQVQATLWPDTDNRKGRSKLDTLVSRLRATLAHALGNHPVQHYFSLSKGMLALKNCHGDATLFLDEARKGLQHAQRGERWQADNAFYIAHQLWNGEFMPATELDGPGADFRSNIATCYLESAAAWGRILLDYEEFRKAVQVVEQALKLDGINHGLVQLMYTLYSRQNNPAAASQVIKTYRESLVSAEFEPAEIDEIIDSLWSKDHREHTTEISPG